MSDPQLQPGESQLASVRLHWFFVFSSFGRFLGTILTLGLSAYFIRNAHTLTVTNRRLILRRGVFTKKVIEMELGRVAQVEVISSWLNRLWGIGRLKVIALDQFSFELYPVSAPDQLKDLVMSAAGESRRALGAPAAANPKDDSLSALERLGKLRESGVLTDAEFESKKRELLARL